MKPLLQSNPGSKNPYDQVPYKSFPIEWTAPERLALASLLHGGPKPDLSRYRVLELGCADGANLLPMAFYRRHAEFVGIDGACSQIEVADARKSRLGLPNVSFVHADFSSATEHVSGQFDFIIAHGIFSWVPDPVRDDLLQLCVTCLRPGGLLYLNYNTFPGWKVRGMVRDLLCSQTAGEPGLLARATRAQGVAAKLASAMALADHPYAKLMSNEFRFVSDSDVSYVAHEFLADDNHAYWRCDFLRLMERHGFRYVADADFNYSSGRAQPVSHDDLVAQLVADHDFENVIDLLSYRQLHSPILTRGHSASTEDRKASVSALRVASCLVPSTATDEGRATFEHPTGFRVEAKDAPIEAALNALHPHWPRSLPVAELFSDVGAIADDLLLLQRQGLIELRCVEPAEFGVAPDLLNQMERDWGGYVTTAHHAREAPPVDAGEEMQLG